MQQTQGQSQDYGGMSHDQILAALSFATHQGEQHLPPADMQDPNAMPVDGSQTSQDAPQQEQSPITEEVQQEQQTTQEQPPEDPIKGLEGRLSVKIDDLGKSLKEGQAKEMKAEMDEIKKTLKNLAS